MQEVSSSISELRSAILEYKQVVESNESKIHKLQQELSKANRRIEELEGAI